jgi:hypothetical protein
MTDILPDSRLRDPTQIEMRHGTPWVRIFCANCGVAAGRVPEHQYTFYQCPPCAERFGPPPGMYALPEERFGELVTMEMQDQYGRQLTEAEIAVELLKNESPLSVLARSRASLVSSFHGV